LEYFVLLFAAHKLSKFDYGELEFYKKVIEVGSSIFAFGFPALIMSYTKSKDSKNYFFLLSILFVFFVASLSIGFLYYFNWLFLFIPFIFYAIFFNGGISPAYFLVRKGSKYSSFYKIIISLLFYGIVFISIYYFDIKGYAYVYVNYLLLPLFLIFIAINFIQEKIIWEALKRYWKLFRKLLWSSFTLVISNFANMMFLYTDIFIIKLLSQESNIDIANYSFALNIANILLLIPLTLVQVDIEKLKASYKYVSDLNKKIMILVIVASLLLSIGFYVLINTYFTEYSNIYILFLIILAAKIVQSMSPVYGAILVVFKKYKLNLYINLLTLLINIVLSYICYGYFSLYGIAAASVISLIIRQILLYSAFNKELKKALKK
jgi:O-antigen/teichoic acid export membrane protein